MTNPLKLHPQTMDRAGSRRIRNCLFYRKMRRTACVLLVTDGRILSLWLRIYVQADWTKRQGH